MILLTAVSYSAYYVTESFPRSVPSPPVIALQLAEQAGPADEVVPQPAPAASDGELPQAESPSPDDTSPASPSAETKLAAVDQPATHSPAPASPASTDVAALQPALTPPVAKKEVPPPVKPTAPSQSEEGTVPGASAVTQPPSGLHATLSVGQHYGIRNKNSRITLRLHGATEVRVGKNSQQIFIDRALGAGDTYRVPNLTGLKLSAEDAGAVEIILDDTTVGFAGKVGVPAKEISLDPKAVVQLQQGG